MATITAFIRTTKKSGNVKIRFRLYDGRDIQLFYISDIEINPLHFDAKRGCYKSKVLINDNIKREVDSAISEIKEVIAQVYKKRQHNEAVSSQWLTRRMNSYYNNDSDIHQGFIPLFNHFVSQLQVGKDRLKHYDSTIKLLKRFDIYMKRNDSIFFLDLDTVNVDVWNSLINYIQNESDLTKGITTLFDEKEVITNRSLNTAISIWKRVKAFLNWALINQHSKNVSHKMVKTKSEVYATPYYITTKERDMIYDFDFSDNIRLEVQRDIFVFHCLVGCRVGDLIELKKNSVISGAIEYVANKTISDRANIIRVPLNKTALKIVEKYKDYEGDELFPFISAQKYNLAIKNIFNIVSITRLVTVINSLTGKEEKVPINTIASSHIARRTFVGNLYKKVKDPNLIGALSGHSEGSRAFARYREIDEEIKKEIIDLL